MLVEVYTDEKSIIEAKTLAGPEPYPPKSKLIGLVKRNRYSEGACLELPDGQLISYKAGVKRNMPDKNQIDFL